MNFGVPTFLLLLLTLPILGASFLLFIRWQRRAINDFAGPQLPRWTGALRARRIVWLLLLVPALAFIVLALARPQIGSEDTTVRRQGIDLVIALDVSQSMLAEDARPNRLEAAKEEMARLMDRLHGHRVGVVVFAGEAKVRFPLTTDISVAQQLLREFSPKDYRLEPGTAIGAALTTATTVFTREETASRVILLVTDGEDLGSQPLEAARTAAEQGIIIYTVGIGSAQGSQIPITDPVTRQTRPKIDPTTGQPAITRLDESLLREIARVSHGRYYGYEAGQLSLTAVADDIGRLARTTFAVSSADRPIERFQPFVLVALALLVAELLLPSFGPARRAARRAALLAAGIVLLALAAACGEENTSLNQEANRLYEQGDYAGALDLYTKAQIERPDLPELHYNAGNALHRLESYDRAAEETRRSLMSVDSRLLAYSYYALGNHLFRQNMLPDALEAYKNALAHNPSDFDTKYNLEVVLALLSQQTPPQGGGQQPNGEPGDSGSPSPEASESPQGTPPPTGGTPGGSPRPSPGPGDNNSSGDTSEWLRTLEEALAGIETEFSIEDALRVLELLEQRPQDPRRGFEPNPNPAQRDW